MAMQSEKLRRAREYEAKELPRIKEDVLPGYHLCGGVGWINDPNGFSLYRGEYHLFFQYHPYNRCWGPMHWGHVKTRDFIRWERLPCALAPDTEYDRDGCYSGSAVELPDGRHMLMYTGVRKETLPDGSVREKQAQCLAFGDGIDYEKYEGNPVIGAADLPEGGSEKDFRDPKIWMEDGGFCAVAGNRCPDGSGAVLLFESRDALSWKLRCALDASGNRHGRMWECPDFFRLDGSSVLLVSPQEMRAEGLEFIEGNVTLCLIGAYDGGTDGLRREHTQTIDYGLDFYAPQTVLTSDGRRVMIAWMQYWNSVDWHPEGLPFFGQMTVPRELRVRDGRLIQNPVRELDAYRGACVRHRRVIIDGTREFEGIRGRSLDMTVTVRPADSCREFRIVIAEGAGYETGIRYDPGAHTIHLDRRKSGFPQNILNERTFAVREIRSGIKIRVLLDRYSMELFVNDGEQAASVTLYTPMEADGICFYSDGAAEADIEKYSLEF